MAKDWVALEALFPTKDRLSSGAAKTTAPKNGFVNKNIGTNPEQAAAVCRIISDAEEDNAPYIVFGPPGTGKTVTLVEAIVQLYKVQGGAAGHSLGFEDENLASVIAPKI